MSTSSSASGSGEAKTWRKQDRGSMSQSSLNDTSSEPGGSAFGASGPTSGPLSGPKKPGSNEGGGSKDDEAYVEITLDVREDSVAVHDIKGGDGMEAAALARRFHSRSSSFGVQLSSKIRQEFKRMTSSMRFDKYDRTKSGATRALKGLQFISKNVASEGWPEVEKRFNVFAVDGFLPRARFGQCIGMRGSEEFAGELLDALARRMACPSSSLSKAQLQGFWELLSDESFDARLQIFFDMVDTNADGRITADEVKEIITLSASANKLSKIKDDAEEYTALIMEELDRDNVGYIEVYNLQTLLLDAPKQQATRGAHSQMLSQMLSQRLVPTREPNPLRRLHAAASGFLLDNWKRLWVVALWLAACAALFAWKFVQYRRRAVFHVMGYCVSVAKGGAETTKLNMALVLLPVCRNTLTWLRGHTGLGAAVPFDDALNFHKVVAAGVAVGVGLHVVSHLTCDFPRLLHATDAEYEPMKRFFGDDRPGNYWWFVKGTEGWTGVAMVVLMGVAYVLAQAWFRRNRLRAGNPLRRLTGFNAFWYSHHLFVVVYVLLVIHGQFLYLTKEWYKKTTWMYLAIPVLLYAAERLIRAFRSSYKPVSILKVAVYPGNVMTIHMTKPKGFHYHSGQYIFVNCSAVSPLQWHPFSITSAPGDDYLSLHIQTVGDWTTRLKQVFSKVCHQPTGDQSGLLRADVGKGQDCISMMPRLRIDGPYGAPAQDYKKYDVLLLVGLGIGATPMISILKDVMNNIKSHDADGGKGADDDTNNGSSNEKKAVGFSTRRAYLYWVTKEQGNFEWFRGVMNDVADNDRDGVIELHNYCTSVYEEGDARSALILMLQSLNHAKHGVDIVSGTRVKTHFARPRWRDVYKHVAIHHTGQRVGVFYCGRPELVPELRRLAKDFSQKTETKFEFHKENF